MWQVTLLVPEQKIPDWLSKITVPGKDETAVRSDIQSRFEIMSLKHKQHHFGPVVFLFNRLNKCLLILLSFSNPRNTLILSLSILITSNALLNCTFGVYNPLQLQFSLPDLCIWKKLLHILQGVPGSKKRSCKVAHVPWSFPITILYMYPCLKCMKNNVCHAELYNNKILTKVKVPLYIAGCSPIDPRWEVGWRIHFGKREQEVKWLWGRRGITACLKNWTVVVYSLSQGAKRTLMEQEAGETWMLKRAGT